MRFFEVLLLVAAFAVCTVSGVFWNSRPKVARVRLRPTRNHGPVTAPHHHPHHRIHNPSAFPSHRHRAPPHPHHNEPIKTYRHPGSSHGSMFMNHHESHMSLSPPFQQPKPHSTHSNRPMPNHKNVEPEPFFHARPGFNKHASPISNLIDQSEFKTPSDSNQHGYLSPTYSGWKPISKPLHLNGYEARPSSYKSDYYVYPSTEAYHDQDGKHQKLILNTLFRDNVKHLKPLKPVKLQPDYTGTQDVSIPLPSEIGEIVRLPSSLFFDKPVQGYYHPFNNMAASQSEDKPVTQKPFPKFQPRPKPSGSHSESNTGADATTPSPPKFKISRPKLRPPIQTQYNNEPEIEGLSHSSLPKPVLQKPVKALQHHQSAGPQHSQQQETLHVKPKFSKVRTRVRVKAAKPEGYVNTDDLSQVISYRPSDQTPVTPRTPGETRIPYAPPEHSSHAPSHSSNIHFGNQTFTMSPRDPPHSPDFPTYSYPEFTRGFDGDKQGQRYVGESTITEGPNHKTLVGHGVDAGGSKTKVVEKPRGGNGERKKRPKHHHRNIASPVVHNESPVYPEDFYMPPGFIQSQSLGGHNHNPVSFMTMPNSQPQVIHHAVHNGHPPSHQSQQHLYPINVIRSPEPHRPEHTHHGTSPNGNYAQNNRPPFVFMNAQNGPVQAFRHADPETPTFAPPSYDTSVGPQPFRLTSGPPYSSPSPYLQGGSPNQQHPTSPVPFQLIPASTPSSAGRPQYQLSQNHAGHYHPISDNHQQPFNVLHGQTSQNNPIFEFMDAQNPKGNLAYASSEYEQIPMEFMNHIRPILLENDEYQGPVLTSSSTSTHHTFYPSESINQDYFNNFFKFKPMEESSTASLEGRVKPYVLGHSGATGENSGYDNYRAASNYEVRVVKPEPQNANTITRQSVSPIPQLSVSSLHDYSIVTTVSPIHDIEFFNSKSPKKWSKLRQSGGGLSSTESYGVSTHKYKKLISRANETAPQPTERTRAPTTPSSFIPTSLTPSKPTTAVSVEVEASYSNPSPLVVKSPLPTLSSFEDDSSDTNIPSTVKLRGTTPRSSSPKPDFSSPQISGSTTTSNYSRRPFRRRRPGLLARRKFFASRLEQEDKGKDDPPVTTHRPRRLLFSPSTTSATQNEEVSTSTDGDGFESSRLALKPRRRNYNRNVNVQSRIGSLAEAPSVGFKSATPSAAEPERVTYGESQWFRVKESADAEGEKSKLNSTNGKTSKNSGLGGEISFSSRILSTTPHAKLEPLETSSESLVESKRLSTKNFYETDSPGVSPHEVDGNGGKAERNDSSGTLETS